MHALRISWLASCALPLITLSAEPWSQTRFSRLGVDQGVSHTTVWDVAQDQRGFLWIATETSVQRYDGYTFVNYRHDPKNEGSLSDPDAVQIHEDRQGNLWIATRQQWVNRYDRTADRFVRYSLTRTEEVRPSPTFVRDMTDDQDGRLWFATLAGLVRLDPTSGEVVHFHHDAQDQDSLSSNTVWTVLTDRDGTLWAGTAQGLDQWGNESGKFVHFPLRPAAAAEPVGVVGLYEAPAGPLWAVTDSGNLFRQDRRSGTWELVTQVGNDISRMAAAPDGHLWFSSFTSGLSCLDPASSRLLQWRHDPNDPESISSDQILSLGWDRAGLLWVGTRDGISLFNPRRSRFSVVRHRATEGLAGRNVSALLEDHQGTVWVGTSEGQLTAWDPLRATFKPVVPGQDGSIRALLETPTGQLWVAGMHGLAWLDRARHQLQLFPIQGLASTILSLALDREGTLWLGTGAQGLLRLGAEGMAKPGAAQPGAAQPAPLVNPIQSSIYALLIDRAGSLWAGAEEGLYRVDPRSLEVTSWRHDPADPTSLSSGSVVDLHQDPAGRLWVATYGGGLNRFDPVRQQFHHYREENGLPHDQVTGLLEDDAGRLWISTNHGLGRFDPVSETFRNYDAEDGLASNVFFIGAHCKTSQGVLLFGGYNGLTAFSPNELQDDPQPPPVVLTELQVEGETMRPGAQGSPLRESITETREFVLNHRQRSFSLTFAAPYFANPGKNRFAFRLAGYDPDWTVTDASNRHARYTNLDPGEYLFQVKASNPDGRWNEAGTQVGLRILPPPWRTSWAYALYSLTLLAGVFAYNRWQEQRLAKERQISAQLRETDRIKNEFLANTSHELRTPLYGITGLAESILDGVHGDLPQPMRDDLAMIVASGQRLGGLVSDILDFSRLRSRELALVRKPLALHAVVEVVMTLVRPLIGSKNLRLRSTVAADLPAVDADENRLQQILLNLVSNAIKFTESGEVVVAAQSEPLPGGQVSSQSSRPRVRVTVRDTGIGIPADQLARILEPFEQVDASTQRAYSGAGLGLAITRQLVELHGGELTVESVVGQGSCFSWTLPVAVESAGVTQPASRYRRPMPPVPQSVEIPDVALTSLTTPTGNSDAGPSILVVDDEPVIRQVLVNQLAPQGYRLLQASSGPEALRLLEQSPDLVLLDVMMPRMSGFEVCQQIRQKHSLDDLPVIYLTAKSQVEDLVQGFASGANDFLTKPIVKEELLARVRTHLQLLQMHRQLSAQVAERTSQVKALGGLLPICSSCKKIRDDDGYWSELETYLNTYSGLRLTHGLCSECSRRLYPEFDLEG